jgi:hypothetical protein
VRRWQASDGAELYGCAVGYWGPEMLGSKFRVVGNLEVRRSVLPIAVEAQFPNCRARSFLGVYLRGTRIVVLFVDRMYAKTLHFLAEPVHLDAAWAEPSAIDGTLIQEIVHK